MKKCGWILLFLSFYSAGFAQQIADKSVADSSTSIGPRVAGMAPPKFFEVQYGTTDGFDIIQRHRRFGAPKENGKVNKLENWRFRTTFPIYLSQSTNILFNYRYSYEEFNFSKPDQENVGLISSLENKHLNTMHGSFLANHRLNNGHFILARVGSELNGDFRVKSLPLARFVKLVATGIYAKKHSINKVTGWGLNYSYDFGGPSLVPVFLYNNTFNSRWGIEALLPAEARVRYTVAPNKFLYGGYDLSGGSYHVMVNGDYYDQFETLELRRSQARLNLSYEQKLFDFVWFSLTGGYNANLNFKLVERNTWMDRNTTLTRFRVKDCAFAQVSVFLVPPKSLMEKAKTRLY